MSRRRYLSTDISLDSQVNRLAVEYGDFAALVYTWMIPHADDAGVISGDLDRLLMLVLPGRRDKNTGDLAAALDGMQAVGLITWDGEGVYLPESFFKHQTYISEERRSKARAEHSAKERPSQLCAENAAEQRVSAQSAESSAEQRPTRAHPQSSSSSLVLSSSSVSSSVEVDAPGRKRRAPTAAPETVDSVLQDVAFLAEQRKRYPYSDDHWTAMIENWTDFVGRTPPKLYRQSFRNQVTWHIDHPPSSGPASRNGSRNNGARAAPPPEQPLVRPNGDLTKRGELMLKLGLCDERGEPTEAALTEE